MAAITILEQGLRGSQGERRARMLITLLSKYHQLLVTESLQPATPVEYQKRLQLIKALETSINVIDTLLQRYQGKTIQGEYYVN